MSYGVSVTKASMRMATGALAGSFPVHLATPERKLISVCGKRLIYVDDASVVEARRYRRFKLCRKCFPEDTSDRDGVRG